MSNNAKRATFTRQARYHVSRYYDHGNFGPRTSSVNFLFFGKIYMFMIELVFNPTRIYFTVLGAFNRSCTSLNVNKNNVVHLLALYSMTRVYTDTLVFSS